MRRVTFTGLLLAAGLSMTLSAASIGGTVYDPSGGVVPKAQIALWNPVTGDRQTLGTADRGDFSFSNLAAGQYLLHVEKPGFAPMYKAVTLQVDTQLHRELILKMGAVEEQVNVQAVGTPAVGSSVPATGPRRIRVGGNVQATQLVTKVMPVYPPSAKMQRVQGSVMMTAEITKEGVPTELTVISTPSMELADSALDAVRQWRYNPTLLNGNPVEVETSILVNYTLTK